MAKDDSFFPDQGRKTKNSSHTSLGKYQKTFTQKTRFNQKNKNTIEIDAQKSPLMTFPRLPRSQNE